MRQPRVTSARPPSPGVTLNGGAVSHYFYGAVFAGSAKSPETQPIALIHERRSAVYFFPPRSAINAIAGRLTHVCPGDPGP